MANKPQVNAPPTAAGVHTSAGGARVVRSARLMVGMEIHVELATKSKMFSRSGNVAHPDRFDAEPNMYVDPVVAGMPGVLPVMNRAAVEMAMKVGLALGCRIAEFTKWDRKSYYYPDLPKGYQISQYDLPLCVEGRVDLPLTDEPGGPSKAIEIIRAHLEEDTGKLGHELPGGGPFDGSLVDLNRAGTPLLEIVTKPDFTSADEVVRFGRLLRGICRHLGVTEGIMQKGHMRFEPNINVIIEGDDGATHATPIVEVKNLNSFKALVSAVEHEFVRQQEEWAQTGREMGVGAKRTRGWDDVRGVTVLQREKEDAHDYRYFPDPDLVPVKVDAEWRKKIEVQIPELPHRRIVRYVNEYGMGAKDATALVEEPPVCRYFEDCVSAMRSTEPGMPGLPEKKAGKSAANMVLQYGAKHAHARGCMVHELGVTPAQMAQIVALREANRIGSNAADELVSVLAGTAQTAEEGATAKGLLQVSDSGVLEAWVDTAIAGDAKSVAAIRGGKVAAVGAIVGAVMKLSGGQADAKAVSEMIRRKLGV